MAGQSAPKPTEVITSPSKKKTLLIIAVAFVIIVTLALGGYFVKLNSTGPDLTNKSMTNAQKETTVNTENGKIIIKEGELPKDFPKDITIYKNSKVERSTEGQEGTVVILTTSDSVAKVTEFYKGDLKKNGWNSIESSSIEGSSLIKAKKDERQLVITVIIDEKDGMTEISIVVGVAQ